MSKRSALLLASEVVCLGVTCLALYGWLAHWNAYSNLTLTFGAVGLWLTRWTAIR